MLFAALVLVFFIVLTIWLIIKFRSKRRIKIINTLKSQENLIDQFEKDYKLSRKKYIARRDVERIRAIYADCYATVEKLYRKLKKQERTLYCDFVEKYREITEGTETLNKAFCEKEKKECQELLANIDNKSLDEQQKDAVVCDEDNSLVIAGAGSGKTLTIVGKVKYLIERKKIKPEDILLISFARKAADEMTERLKKIGIELEAATFHKFGLEIISLSCGSRPDVFDDSDLRSFLEDFFTNQISTIGGVTIQNLTEFFAYYIQIPAEARSFEEIGRVYENERKSELETLKSKFLKTKAEEFDKDKRTLNGEFVKSHEEVQIANFMFLHGIEYEYERLYPHVSENEGRYRKKYRPDFYLPKYDIYLEHFAIDENGNLPQFTPVEEQKYKEGVDWKRKIHKKHKTKLIETYTWYSRKGILLTELEKTLKKAGVVVNDPPYEEIYDAVFKDIGDKYYKEFIKLCGTFLQLYKSNGYDIDSLETLNYKSKQYQNPFFRERLKLFKSIIKVLIERYENNLKQLGKVDFSDMIMQAVKCIDSGYDLKKHKYVIVDEFQDISLARYKLLKCIVDKCGAKLFCVGDDWQSIYRFTGSDIGIFSRFEDYFGFTKVLKLETTYRVTQNISDIASDFILKNPAQREKKIEAQRNLKYPLKLYLYDNEPFPAIRSAIEDINKNFDNGKSILILGRTNYDKDLLNAMDFKEGKGGAYLVSSKYKGLEIKFLTVHKAKGLEADNVIILNFNNSTLGFPNKISDDPLLELVLSDSDTFLYAEERRLFYVALTRSKNNVYLIANRHSASEFLHDINDFAKRRDDCMEVKSFDFELPSVTINCPKCKTGILTAREGEYGSFTSCSNFPACDYSVNTPLSKLNEAMKCSCGGFFVLRTGIHGSFYGCSNYPFCKKTKPF